MGTALRPMNTGEVLDRTFNLYRNHFWLFTGIAAGYGLCLLIGVLILILFGMLSFGETPDFGGILQLFVSELIIGLFALIGYAVAAGPTVMLSPESILASVQQFEAPTRLLVLSYRARYASSSRSFCVAWERRS